MNENIGFLFHYANLEPNNNTGKENGMNDLFLPINGQKKGRKGLLGKRKKEMRKESMVFRKVAFMTVSE